MDNREHLYWSLVFFSTAIFVFTAAFGYKDVHLYWYIALIAVFAASCIFNEMANTIKARDDKKDRENGEIKKKQKEPSESFETMKFRLFTYLCLGIYIFICVYIGTASSDHSIFVMAGYVGAFAGGQIPDLDIVATGGDMRLHRNPISHSNMFVLPFAVIALLTLPDEYISLMLMVIGVVLGNTSHLVVDNIQSKTTLSDLILDFKHFKQCPGNIQGIKEERERTWLNSNASFGLFFVVLMFARFNLTPAMYYPLFWDGWSITWAPLAPMSIFILLLTMLYYIFCFIALKLWKKEKKTTKTRRKETIKKEKGKKTTDPVKN